MSNSVYQLLQKIHQLVPLSFYLHARTIQSCRVDKQSASAILQGVIQIQSITPNAAVEVVRSNEKQVSGARILH